MEWGGHTGLRKNAAWNDSVTHETSLNGTPIHAQKQFVDLKRYILICWAVLTSIKSITATFLSNTQINSVEVIQIRYFRHMDEHSSQSPTTCVIL